MLMVKTITTTTGHVVRPCQTRSAMMSGFRDKVEDMATGHCKRECLLLLRALLPVSGKAHSNNRILVQRTRISQQIVWSGLEWTDCLA